MTTQKKQGHHFVPNNSYLKNFADASGKVWVLDRAGKLYQTNPANIFKEGNFYTITLKNGGGSLVVEDTLANIEGVFATLYRDKIEKGLLLTPAERAQAAVFFAALYLRTKSHREGIQGMLGQLHDSMQRWKTMFENNPKAREFAAAVPRSSDSESIYMEDVKDALDNVGEFHTTTMMDSLPEVAQIIFEMKWCFMTAPSGFEFITSEDPFQILRPESIKKYGAKAIGSVPGLVYNDSEVTIPLSSTHAILAGWQLDDNFIIEAERALAEQINIRTLMRAQDVVAQNRSVLDKIIDNA